MCRLILICVSFGLGCSQALAAMPAVKVSIQSEGMYAITYANLAQLGIDVAAVDPRRLALRYRDQPVAISVTGEDDGSFDPGDRVLFYARGIHWQDEAFSETDIDVYWLEEGGGPGLRMQSSNGATALTAPGGGWLASEHFEIDRIYNPGVGFPAEAPRFFWEGPVRAFGQATVQFTPFQSVDTEKPAQVAVRLQGITDDPGLDPDHRTQILLNQCVLGDGRTWNGMIGFVQQETVPAGCLVNGSNSLTLRSLGAGTAIDSVYLDGFDISYAQTDIARNDRHVFTGTVPVTLSGFTSPAIDIYAITDPHVVRFLASPTIAGEGSDHHVSFDDPQAGAEERYFVLAQTAYRTPAALALRSQASALKATDHAVDYIIVSHPSLLDGVQPLAEHRRAQGLRVLVVDVMEVYDEFSHGVSISQAIRDFLAYAYFNWQVRPAYVVLVGDATVSFKGTVLNAGPNYVPTHFFRAFDGAMVPGDNWFVTVDGDDPLPDMYIGRLPVTPENVAGTIRKIIDYDQPEGDAVWRRRAFFVTDNEPGFWETSDRLVGALSPSYEIRRLYLGRTPLFRDPRDQIRDQIAEGSIITTFTGHGASSYWAINSITTSDDVVQWSNRDRLTFVVALNCLNGYFVGPSAAVNRLSLAEAFVTSEQGGAVAAWAASYLGYTADHEVMGKRLFDAIRTQDDRGLGSVTTQARIQALGDGAREDTVDSFIYFGDPATVLASRGMVGSGGGSGGGSLDMVLLALLAGGWLATFRMRGPRLQCRRACLD